MLGFVSSNDATKFGVNFRTLPRINCFFVLVFHHFSKKVEKSNCYSMLRAGGGSPSQEKKPLGIGHVRFIHRLVFVVSLY